MNMLNTLFKIGICLPTIIVMMLASTPASYATPEIAARARITNCMACHTATPYSRNNLNASGVGFRPSATGGTTGSTTTPNTPTTVECTAANLPSAAVATCQPTSGAIFRPAAPSTVFSCTPVDSTMTDPALICDGSGVVTPPTGGCDPATDPNCNTIPGFPTPPPSGCDSTVAASNCPPTGACDPATDPNCNTTPGFSTPPPSGCDSTVAGTNCPPLPADCLDANGNWIPGCVNIMPIPPVCDPTVTGANCPPELCILANGTLDPNCKPPIACMLGDGTIDPNCVPPELCILANGTLDPNCKPPVLCTLADGSIDPICKPPVACILHDGSFDPKCEPPIACILADGSLIPNCEPPIACMHTDGSFDPACLPPEACILANGTLDPACIPPLPPSMCILQDGTINPGCKDKCMLASGDIAPACLPIHTPGFPVDEDGNPVFPTDADGRPFFPLDEDGNPIFDVPLDDDGNPIRFPRPQAGHWNHDSPAILPFDPEGDSADGPRIIRNGIHGAVMAVGQERTFSLSAIGPSLTQLDFSSNTVDIATVTVSENKVTVKALSEGFAEIIVTVTDPSGWSDFIVIPLTVNDPEKHRMAADGMTEDQKRDHGLDPNEDDFDNDGIPDAVELGDPNHPHDTDGDGIPDVHESGARADDDSVADGAKLDGGDRITFESPGEKLSHIETRPTGEGAFDNVDRKFGEIAFRSTSPVGQEQVIILRMTTPLPNPLVIYKVNLTGNYEVFPKGQWTRIDAFTVEMRVLDGGRFDHDGSANGIVVDPVAFGTKSTDAGGETPVDDNTTPATSSAGGGCLTSSEQNLALMMFLLLMGCVTLFARRQTT